MTGISWGPTQPILTERLILRPHREDDLDDLVLYTSDPEVVRFVPWQVSDREATREALARKIVRGQPSDDEAWLVLAVELADTGRVIGEVLLKRDPDDHRLGEVGYAVARDMWGRGFIPEAAEALITWGFDALGMHRISAICDVRNDASWRVMEKLGMRREASFVDSSWFKDEWTSTYVYAVLGRDWSRRPRRRRVEPDAFEPPDSEQHLQLDIASGSDAVAALIGPDTVLGERGTFFEHPRASMVLDNLRRFSDLDLTDAADWWTRTVGSDSWDDLDLIIETPRETVRHHWWTTA